jgi:hypothetical protein
MSAHLIQRKAMADGQVRTWTLDLPAMAHCCGWSKLEPEFLQEELEGILEAFPTFIAALGVHLEDKRCWVEAAEPLLCSRCKELVVFDEGVRCVSCRQPIAVPDQAVIGLVGRIPALISGRPFATDLERRIMALRQSNPGQSSIFQRSILVAQGRRYLAPRFGLWFSQAWPHADPPVMVWSEYFDILNIPPDHVFFADQYFRLCLYATWREQPAVKVLQHRVVPRLLIDLIVADLQALGKLDQALEQLDSSLYELYNTVGRPELSAPLQQIYEQLLSLANHD